MFLPEKTVRYKTYFKRAITEGLVATFASHPDEILRQTNVTVEYPNKKEHYPAVLIRFNEREVRNAGVGHVEFLYDDDEIVKHKYRHSFYTGNLMLTVYSLSTLDRDLISDTLVGAIQMADTAAYTKLFWDRLYAPSATTYPDAVNNFVNLNHDLITASGEGQMPPPWQTEDEMLFTCSYSVPVFGEFYSVPPTTTLANITKVNIYPYIGGLESVPTGVDDPSPWV
jgi:hypothetical protein